MVRANSGGAILLALLVTSATASGQDPVAAPPVAPKSAEAPVEHPSLAVAREARKAFQEVRTDEEVLALLDQIDAEDPPLAWVTALEIRAILLIRAGQAARAQPLLEELYFLAPAYVLTDASVKPQVTKMFEEEAARPHKRSVSLDLQAHGNDLRTFQLAAGGATVRVELACRAGEKAPFLPLQIAMHGHNARFRLPNQGAFACHAVALDRDGLPLGRLGTPTAPTVIRSRTPTPPPAPTPITESWWFWTGLSAIAAGAVVVAVVVATSSEDPPDADLTVAAQPVGINVFEW